MKPKPLIALTIVLCLGGSFAFSHLLDRTGAGASAAERLNRRIDELDSAFQELSTRHRGLTDAVHALDAARGEPAVALVREPVLSVEEAVDRWIRSNRPELAAAVRAPVVLERQVEGHEDGRTARAVQFVALLDDPELDDEGWNQVWKKISDADLLDEAVAILEQRVVEDPDNPEAHLALAGGYFGKSVNTANDMEKGIWAVKADKALDHTLELDPWHWEARFTKAISLSLYPPVMGKRGEALKHFEILRDQQRQLPLTPEHVQTYLYLGNLYLQTGDQDKARQVWQEGLGLYPQSAELAGRLEHAGKQ